MTRTLPPSKYPTGTLAASNALVPWLAATGPLAYTPECPPGRDYYFQYVVGKTPLTNIRITTFFAGEAEAKVINPNKVERVEAVGCEWRFGCRRPVTVEELWHLEN